MYNPQIAIITAGVQAEIDAKEKAGITQTDEYGTEYDSKPASKTAFEVTPMVIAGVALAVTIVALIIYYKA
jgi:hypothetical protein